MPLRLFVAIALETYAPFPSSASINRDFITMSDRDCGTITYGYVDPNWPRPETDDSACIIIYGCVKPHRTTSGVDHSCSKLTISFTSRYVPSLALGILGVILFSLALALHLWLLVRHKTWYFSTVILGLVMEIIGYV